MEHTSSPADATATGERSERPVALITGGGTGIGAASAKTLRDAGWNVVICGRRTEQLEAVAEATGAIALQSDIADEAAATALRDAVLERFGRLDGLVLNAAVVSAGPFASLDDAAWRLMLETNLVSAARLARTLLPLLVDSRGSILGVASLAALRVSGILSGYSASKAGLALLMQSIAYEYGRHGVRANLICPGLIATEMSAASLEAAGAARGLTLDEAYLEATKNVPLRRAAEPSEVSSVVRFLLSDEASYVTGAVLPVDGGASTVDVAALIYETEEPR